MTEINCLLRISSTSFISWMLLNQANSEDRNDRMITSCFSTVRFKSQVLLATTSHQVAFGLLTDYMKGVAVDKVISVHMVPVVKAG